jgi:type II secretory pathway pseudopilin PulG
MKTERGLTLVEIMLSMSVLATSALGVAMSMMTGIAANRTYQMNTMVLARAQHYVETLNNLQFGDNADPVLVAPNDPNDPLAVIFNPDVQLGANPPSLSQIAQTIDLMANDMFDTDTVADFPEGGLPGDFLIRVSNNVLAELDYPADVDGDDDGIPDDGVASLVQGEFIEQVVGEGCFETDDDDTGRELYGYEVWYRPDFPANAAPRLVLRAMRAQDL